jgi:hypothetical protein
VRRVARRAVAGRADGPLDDGPAGEEDKVTDSAAGSSGLSGRSHCRQKPAVHFVPGHESYEQIYYGQRRTGNQPGS